jgi:hypothetical protein
VFLQVSQLQFERSNMAVEDEMERDARVYAGALGSIATQWVAAWYRGPEAANH